MEITRVIKIPIADMDIIEINNHDEETYEYYVRYENSADFNFMFAVHPDDRFTENNLRVLAVNGYFDEVGD